MSDQKTLYGKITFTMIKPGERNQENIGPILTKITENGFRIEAMKLVKLRTKQAEVFYSHLSDKPFYNDLVKYMTSGPVLAMILEKENAVSDFRVLIGDTDPTKAKEGTIRNLYAESLQKNAIHGSDSDENAALEAGFFFSTSERYNKNGECFLKDTWVVR
ncbi:nucleoside-diphosphate kinase [Sediminitomix flava]|uniref:Nucleoside diphosphate kinase n=1 Tax=Sediminitomix flava TaxID=379075 RepID=A0A315ZFX1_SEDFL|nr:nucleoside-diphosphate kinase [Sediminitomix flava]PWJ44053.1 nucleoside diphosphate kinase [Sediminitomix flava]